MEAIETFEINGCNVKIYHDDDPLSPRDVDNLCVMYCWHSHYNLGDERGEHISKEELLEKHPDILAVLPLYLYDHSGITISTGPFSCQFDSGQVGWAYITQANADRMLCNDESWWTKLAYENQIISEVNYYDHYLRGNAYGYVLTKDGDPEADESCWGFIGDVSYCKQEAINVANGY